jgi:hypothetical protein
MASLKEECPVCGSRDLEMIEGECESGVYAPDGDGERWHWFAIKCRNCGSLEEL